MATREELPHNIAPCIDLGRALRQFSDALVFRDSNRNSTLELGAEPIDSHCASLLLEALNQIGVFDAGLQLSGQTANGHPMVQTGDGKTVVLTTHLTTNVVNACTIEMSQNVRENLSIVFFGRQNPDVSAARRRNLSAQNVWLASKILRWSEKLLKEDDAHAEERIERATETLLAAASLVAPSPLRRRRAILVGNGLNRVSNEISWTEVLKKIAGMHLSGTRLDDALQIVENPTIPSPIKFEYLSDYIGEHSASAFGGKTNPFTVLKDDLANIMQGLDKTPKGLNPLDPELAALLDSIGFDYVLTTNYDTLLEQCVPSLAGLVEKRIPANTKYLLDATAAGGAGDAIVFHPHGIVEPSGSICIGYEHYMGYVQRLRERLIARDKSRESAWRLAYLMLGAMPLGGTWEELFFTSDLAIVGLGMDYEESDLWELLTLRAAVLQTSDTLKRYLSHASKDEELNKITFYDVEPQEGLVDSTITNAYDPITSTEHTKGKADVLKGLEVQIRVAHVPKSDDSPSDFKQAYKLILEDLNNTWP